MIGLPEIVGVSLLSFLLFRLIGNGGAGFFLCLYVALRILWAMAGVEVERERSEKERWQREHPEEVYQPAPGLFSRRSLDGIWRWLVALARGSRRVGRERP